MRIMRKHYAYDHPMYSAIWHSQQRSPGDKNERTSTKQQLLKNEQTGRRPGRYQQPKQNRQKQRKLGGNENFS